VAIEDEILRYLARHPEARDTLKGIVEWWVLEQRIECTAAEVKSGLEKLVARNLVMVRHSRDCRTYYGAIPKRADCEEFGLGW